jgi:hypothetical protein
MKFPQFGRNGFATVAIMAMQTRMPDRAFQEFMHGLFAAIDIGARPPIPREATQ